jgi:hypothetical protein
METTQNELTLAEEPTPSSNLLFSNQGELHLTAENISLIDEIKILIRKLWN